MRPLQYRRAARGEMGQPVQGVTVTSAFSQGAKYSTSHVNLKFAT